MKLEDIELLAENSLEIDSSELEQESTKTPLLHNKFYKILNQEAIVLAALESKVDSIVHDRTEYYSGRQLERYKEEPLDIVVPIKDVDRFVDADRKVIEVRLQYAGQKQKVKYLESVIKQINDRTHHIRNAIAFLNFKNGVNR